VNKSLMIGLALLDNAARMRRKTTSGRMAMRAWIAAAAACVFALGAGAQEVAQAPRVVLVTIDGLRWQEVFAGADPALTTDARYRARFIDVPDRRRALMPFLASFEAEGALIGDRNAGSCARVANDYWFSYPGYAEMLSGRPNPAVRSNAARPNADQTILERVAARPEFAGRVHAAAEWGVMAAILNVERSKLPLFVSPQDAPERDPPAMAAAHTFLTAETRLAYVDLGDTDTSAHAGDYHRYLAAAANADRFLQEVWEGAEADPNSAGRTTLIVSTDHGRGDAADDNWRGHGSGRWRGMTVPGLRKEGSDATFIAARGPRIAAPRMPYTPETCATAGQIAGTVLEALGLWEELRTPEMAEPLAIFH
jgi:hypothetical protein